MLILTSEVIIVNFTGATVLVRSPEGTVMRQHLFILLILTGRVYQRPGALNKYFNLNM